MGSAQLECTNKVCSLVGYVAASVALDEADQLQPVRDVWVGLQDLLHRALGVERAQLAPQVVPLLAVHTSALAAHRADGEAGLAPGVPGQAVALSLRDVAAVLHL